MKTTAGILLLAVFLFGCSKGDPHFPGYKVASGDAAPFVLDSATVHGARPFKTSGFPKIEAKWRYKADKDGVQIYLVGDYMPQVQALLLAAFGPPAIPAKTNQDGHISGAVYAASVIGAAISYGRDDPSGGTPYTQIVIVRQGALKP